MVLSTYLGGGGARGWLTKPELIDQQISPPMLEPHEALVKVATMAQNPTDVQMFDVQVLGNGTELGCDFTGAGERLGKEVSEIAEGDMINGFLLFGKLNITRPARSH
ncbi:zinc-type alcohol dehydrogenase [Fusarium denticulatum]|uniref:Zinc-type alcohol dehydrogenase n=1 Tax=Fusarium denticulatum TaxID=48507 RepID=A0A8H5XF41_9HYPO|nr:zinc-type alcohol dehydrogenase [Fusarium denticulatum]